MERGWATPPWRSRPPGPGLPPADGRRAGLVQWGGSRPAIANQTPVANNNWHWKLKAFICNGDRVPFPVESIATHPSLDDSRLSLGYRLSNALSSLRVRHRMSRETGGTNGCLQISAEPTPTRWEPPNRPKTSVIGYCRTIGGGERSTLSPYAPHRSTSTNRPWKPPPGNANLATLRPSSNRSIHEWHPKGFDQRRTRRLLDHTDARIAGEVAEWLKSSASTAATSKR